MVSVGAATFLSPHQRAAEAGQVNVVHVSSFWRNRKFLNAKAEYGNASRVITWRILCRCFSMGSFRCPSKDIDSRVRHAYFCAGDCARIQAAHFNMSDKVGNVSPFYSVWEGGAGRMRGKLRKEVVQW